MPELSKNIFADNEIYREIDLHEFQLFYLITTKVLNITFSKKVGNKFNMPK